MLRQGFSAYNFLVGYSTIADDIVIDKIKIANRIIEVYAASKSLERCNVSRGMYRLKTSWVTEITVQRAALEKNLDKVTVTGSAQVPARILIVTILFLIDAEESCKIIQKIDSWMLFETRYSYISKETYDLRIAFCF